MLKQKKEGKEMEKEIKKEKLENLKKVKIVKKDLYEFNDDFIPEESEAEECQEKKK